MERSSPSGAAPRANSKRSHADVPAPALPLPNPRAHKRARSSATVAATTTTDGAEGPYGDRGGHAAEAEHDDKANVVAGRLPKGAFVPKTALQARKERLPGLAREVTARALEGTLLPAQLLLQAVTGGESLDDIAKEWPTVQALDPAHRLVVHRQGIAYVSRSDAEAFLAAVADESRYRKGLRHQVYKAIERDWHTKVFGVVDEALVARWPDYAPPAAKHDKSAAHASRPSTNPLSSPSASPLVVIGATSIPSQPPPKRELAPEEEDSTDMHFIRKAADYAQLILQSRADGAAHWKRALEALAIGRLLARPPAGFDLGFADRASTRTGAAQEVQEDIVGAACLMLGLVDPAHTAREVPPGHDPVLSHIDNLRIALGRLEMDAQLHKLAHLLQQGASLSSPSSPSSSSFTLPELALVLDAHALQARLGPVAALMLGQRGEGRPEDAPTRELPLRTEQGKRLASLLPLMEQVLRLLRAPLAHDEDGAPRQNREKRTHANREKTT